LRNGALPADIRAEEAKFRVPEAGACHPSKGLTIQLNDTLCGKRRRHNSATTARDEGDATLLNGIRAGRRASRAPTAKARARAAAASSRYRASPDCAIATAGTRSIPATAPGLAARGGLGRQRSATERAARRHCESRPRDSRICSKRTTRDSRLLRDEDVIVNCRHC